MFSRRFLSCVILSLSAIHPVRGQMANTLTDAEKAAGWQLMFDGKSLEKAGWHSFSKTTINLLPSGGKGWVIQDSCISLAAQGAGGLLAPEAFAFRNFEISIDWKLPDSGNSGIFLRYIETQESENIRTGPETQICGRLNWDYKTGTEPTSAGACYSMFPPESQWIKPADQFNTLHIIMWENKVAHFGNGMKLLEYTIGDSVWSARYSTSKYRLFPLYGDIHPGKLFLQDHASRVWYRNIKIRPLDKDPWAEVSILARRSPARGIRFGRIGDGRLGISAESGREWELSLLDPLGRSHGVYGGAGSRSVGIARTPAGFYLLSGKVDGNRFEASLPLPGR